MSVCVCMLDIRNNFLSNLHSLRLSLFHFFFCLLLSPLPSPTHLSFFSLFLSKNRLASAMNPVYSPVQPGTPYGNPKNMAFTGENNTHICIYHPLYHYSHVFKNGCKWQTTLLLMLTTSWCSQKLVNEKTLFFKWILAKFTFCCCSSRKISSLTMC